MSARDELTIWMLSTARKAPRAAPTTASQVLAVTLASASTLSLACGDSGSTGVARCGAAAMSGSRRPMADMAGLRAWPDGSALSRLARGRDADEAAAAGALGQHGRLGIDRRLDRHPRAQQAGQRVGAVERDLHGDALHDLREVAGGVVGRQQAELEAARRRQAVDMAADRGIRK